MDSDRLFAVQARSWAIKAHWDSGDRAWVVRVAVAGPRQALALAQEDVYSHLTTEEARDLVSAIVWGLEAP